MADTGECSVHQGGAQQRAGVHLRVHIEHVAWACQGTVEHSNAEAGLPSSTSSLSHTTLHDGKAVPGRRLVEILYGTSYCTHLVKTV